jgi:hypothetical protein
MQATKIESRKGRQKLGTSPTLQLNIVDVDLEQWTPTARYPVGGYPVGINPHDLMVDANELLTARGIALGIALRARANGDMARFKRWIEIEESAAMLFPALD